MSFGQESCVVGCVQHGYKCKGDIGDMHQRLLYTGQKPAPILACIEIAYLLCNIVIASHASVASHVGGFLGGSAGAQGAQSRGVARQTGLCGAATAVVNGVSGRQASVLFVQHTFGLFKTNKYQQL